MFFFKIKLLKKMDMKVGRGLYLARKEKGLFQEQVVDKLGVSRQTISKWELDETVPDIIQTKLLADLYNLPIDELVKFDEDENNINKMMDMIDEKVIKKIDWHEKFAKKFPYLDIYHKHIDVDKYFNKINNVFNEIQQSYNLDTLMTLNITSDLLFKVFQNKNKGENNR